MSVATVTLGLIAMPVAVPFAGACFAVAAGLAIAANILEDRRARADSTEQLRRGAAAARKCEEKLARDTARMWRQINAELQHVADLEAALALDFDGEDH